MGLNNYLLFFFFADIYGTILCHYFVDMRHHVCALFIFGKKQGILAGHWHFHITFRHHGSYRFGIVCLAVCL